MASAIDVESFEYLRSEHSDEMEVLVSIYDGDDRFKPVNGHTIQYKFGETDEPLSILVEIKWGAEYPDIIPTISLDSFYNQHLSSGAKVAALNAINEEAWKNLGDQQTYTLIEWMKDNILTLIGSYVFDDVCRIENREKENQTPENPEEKDEEVSKKESKKEQLTKAQKRREWNRVDKDGNRPRGYDWVDVVRHLSQTGGGPGAASMGGSEPANPPT